MIDGAFALAFSAGMVATINPCGFAMLPAYLGLFVGMDEGEADPVRSTIRSLIVGATVTAGFMVVFLIAGVAISGLGLPIQEYLPYVTVAIGLGLVALSIAMLRGYVPTLSLPKLNKGGESGELLSMFVFGISYAVASISCTMPVFLFVTTTSLNAPGFPSKIGVFASYAAGMGLVLMVVTLAVGLAKTGVVNKLRSLMPKITRISAYLLLVASLYIVLYGYFEIRVTILSHHADFLGADIVLRANEFQADANQWVNDSGPIRIGQILAAVVASAVVLAWGWRASKPKPIEAA